MCFSLFKNRKFDKMHTNLDLKCLWIILIINIYKVVMHAQFLVTLSSKFHCSIFVF